MAPEVAIGKQHGTSVDYFALGVVLYELCIGRVLIFTYINLFLIHILETICRCTKKRI